MAEMVEKDTGGKKGPGVQKPKKKSTRVDLTPMVDLGFLLITFFIFSITMEQASSMNLNLPDDTKPPDVDMKVKGSGSLTLLLGKGNVIYYYYGNNPTDLETTTYKDVRNIILEKKKSTPPDDLFIIIKPDPDATYKNTVDVLDEMNINDISKYAMVDASPEEYDLIKKTEEAAGIN